MTLMRGLDVSIVDVTPELAQEILGLNTSNRKLRERNIAAWARDMREGNWLLNGETIKISDDGVLLDGQHRMRAVVESGVTVPFLFVRNLPHQAQDSVDTGILRKFSDVLKLRGEPNNTALASLVRRVALWKQGIRQSGGYYAITTIAQMNQALEDHPECRAIVVEAHRVSRGCSITLSTVGMAMWLFNQVDEEDAKEFFARLADGQNVGRGNPIYELRRTTEALRKAKGTVSDYYVLALIIKAWNAYRSGTEITLLRFKPGGANPEKFPEPK